MTQPKKIQNGVIGRQKLLKTFSIDYTSDVDGTRYKGTFTTKKLSISDLATLGVRKTQLNAGMHHDPNNPGMGVDAQTDDFNSMIAHLDVALQEAPQWWDLSEITDADLLALVFEEVASHESSFLRSSRQGGGHSGQSDGGVANGEGLGESGSQEANSDGTAGEVVEQEVQSALEP